MNVTKKMSGILFTSRERANQIQPKNMTKLGNGADEITERTARTRRFKVKGNFEFRQDN